MGSLADLTQNDDVEQLLEVAAGPLEPESAARHALVELWARMDDGPLLAQLRKRGLRDAVAFVKWMSRESRAYEATLPLLRTSTPAVAATTTVGRSRARARRSRTTRRPQRGAPDREPDPPPSEAAA